MKKFKKGDKVVMHTCGEANYYNGKIWICKDDSIERDQQSELVFLEGFSGSFMCKYLQLVDVSEYESEIEKLKNIENKYNMSFKNRLKEVFKEKK